MGMVSAGALPLLTSGRGRLQSLKLIHDQALHVRDFVRIRREFSRNREISQHFSSIRSFFAQAGDSGIPGPVRIRLSGTAPV